MEQNWGAEARCLAPVSRGLCQGFQFERQCYAVPVWSQSLDGTEHGWHSSRCERLRIARSASISSSIFLKVVTRYKLGFHTVEFIELLYVDYRQRAGWKSSEQSTPIQPFLLRVVPSKPPRPWSWKGLGAAICLLLFKAGWGGTRGKEVSAPFYFSLFFLSLSLLF